MADITGNPTPLNVPAPLDARGTLTPLQGAPANLATAPVSPAEPIGVRGARSYPSSLDPPPPPADPVGVPVAPSLPSTPNTTPPPAVPGLT